MKFFKFLRVLTFVFVFSQFSVKAQPYNERKMPLVTENLLDQYPFWFNLDHRITLGGAWGMGFSAQYTKRKVIHATAHFGYAWAYGSKDKENENPLQKRFWRPYAEISSGYPVLDFTWGLKSRYILSSWSSGNVQYQRYFRAKIPVTTMIIPQANFRLNPHAWKFSRSTGNSSNLPSTMSQAFVLPTIGVGLKILTMGCAKFRAKVDGGKAETYTAQRMGSIYLGLVRPVFRKEITPGEPYSPRHQTPENEVLGKWGFDILFEMTPYHNSASTFFFGVRSVGYNNNAQFVIGNTFMLN